MKSQMCESQLFAKNGVLGGVKHDKIFKHKDTTEEMQMYLNKLKDLVPYMPRNKKVSKLEIIQNVIDYICDLQGALESHPAARSTSLPVVLAHTVPVVCSSTSPIRQPLGVSTAQNTPVSSTCAAQEASHQDKHTTHLEEMSRSVSC